jgi:magnesium-protoporphyrin O-methyltransferase
MDGCGCDDFASIFDRRTAERDRDRYHKKGADRTTRILFDLIRPSLATGSTILDVGGGIGVIDHELLRAGAGHAVLVEASPAYLEVARQEARRQNLLDRIEFVEGDFVRRADGIDAADIVTLDRVVCCYPDVAALVGSSAARARMAYGLVLPRDGWLNRLGLRLVNLGFRIRGRAYRAYAHPNATIDRLAAANGLRPRSERSTWFWRIVVYDRAGERSTDHEPSTGEQQAQPPSTDPTTASAASQHGPAASTTARDRLGRSRWRWSPTRRASRA